MKPENRQCKKCGKQKPLEAFPEYRGGSRRHECHECYKSRMNSYYAADAGRYKKKARRYYAKLRKSPSRYAELLERKKPRARAYLAEQRARVLMAYGGPVCACCGEREERFLTIDHVKNNGKDMRKLHGTGSAMYSWLIARKFPKGFQVLCMNCNFGKAMNGGICPHQAGSTTIPKGSTRKRGEARGPKGKR